MLNEINIALTKGESMKKQMKKILMVSTLSVLSVAPLQAQDYNTGYTGSRNWTNANASASQTCAHSQRRIECAINLTYKLANSVYAHVSYEDYGNTFLPILQAAAEASDTLIDLGAWSLETRDAVQNLINILEMKQAEIDEFMTIPAHFSLARKLKSTIRIIKREFL